MTGGSVRNPLCCLLLLIFHRISVQIRVGYNCYGAYFPCLCPKSSLSPQTSMFPVRNNILISDAAAIKVVDGLLSIESDIYTWLQEITLDRFRYPKPLESYEGLNVFGTNIVFSEGDLWKTYRKLSSPAFADVCCF
jgi:hypothetical protein